MARQTAYKKYIAAYEHYLEAQRSPLRYRVAVKAMRHAANTDNRPLLEFIRWLVFYGQALVRRLVILGLMIFIGTVVGSVLYVHARFAHDRDMLLLCYLVAVAVGLVDLLVARLFRAVFGVRR